MNELERLREENAELKAALEDRQLCIKILVCHMKNAMNEIQKKLNYLEYTADDICLMADKGKLQNIEYFTSLFALQSINK